MDRKLEDDISSSKADLAKIKEHALSAEKIVSKVKEFKDKVSKKEVDLKYKFLFTFCLVQYFD